MIKCLMAIAIVLYGTVAIAENVVFRAKWQPVTKDTKGNAINISEYILYVCDKPIILKDGKASCTGKLAQYPAIVPEITGSYDATGPSGVLYFRVTAKNVRIESGLSDEVSAKFESDQKPVKPGGLLINSIVVTK